MHPIDVKEQLVITPPPPPPPVAKQQIWFTASFCLALGFLLLNQLQHRATVLLGLEQLLNEMNYILPSQFNIICPQHVTFLLMVTPLYGHGFPLWEKLFLAEPDFRQQFCLCKWKKLLTVKVIGNGCCSTRVDSRT